MARGDDGDLGQDASDAPAGSEVAGGAVPGPAGLAVLTVDALTSTVHARFTKKRREEVPIAVVREIVAGLDLSTGVEHPTPRLRLTRLRFVGTKRLRGEPDAPIDYDQELAPGVNVLLIPDNLVGKSSIFKTVKYALTGDDSDYDADVRAWIRDVWLQFTLDDAPFTVHLARGEDGTGGYLAAGHTLARSAAVQAPAVVLERFHGSEHAKDELHHFFLRAFGFSELSWTQAAADGVAERSTSWRTFFQALMVPDSSEEYLLLDDTHAIGNQVGLILSVFLGLRLVEPLNDLLVERQKAQGHAKVSDEERARAEAELKELLARRADLEGQLQALEKAQLTRRAAVLDNPDARRQRELITRQAVLDVELLQLGKRHAEQNTNVQRLRAQADSLRQGAALRRHFTGLQVALCPNCDADVDADAVERERHEHLCRLCGKEAHAANPDDLALMEAEADDLEHRAAEQVRVRDSLAEQRRALAGEREQLDGEIRRAGEAITHGPAYAPPTPEEDARRAALLLDLGELRGQIGMTTAVAERAKADVGGTAVKSLARTKVREVLQEQAKALNADVLRQLGTLVGEMTSRIGADSISDVTISPLGALGLSKNGVKVTFGSINNPGERLRVKLAFFLAMMRLGRLKGAGRHPGFLMIDQPGSDEIVDEDFTALAKVLREVDRDFADGLQVFCFTARPQFADATTPEKVYGPTAGKYAF